VLLGKQFVLPKDFHIPICLTSIPSFLLGLALDKMSFSTCFISVLFMMRVYLVIGLPVLFVCPFVIRSHHVNLVRTAGRTGPAGIHRFSSTVE
jgi:hypothetical protein